MTVVTRGLRDRLERIEARYEEVGRLMSDPEVTSDRQRLRDLGREHADLSAVVELIALLRELHGLSLKEAIKMAAKLTGQAKSSLYKQAHL